LAEVFSCVETASGYLSGLVNSEYMKQALAKVGNSNVLINLVSRRVRQLTSAGGSTSRPLIEVPPGTGVADTALLEIIEGKMDWVADPQAEEEIAPTPKKRGKK
jgi:hypothetical protein